METQQSLRVEPWMRGLLLLAGFYNIGWGFFINQFPDAFYQWITMSARTAPLLTAWQGAVVIAFGIAYMLVAIYPIRLWFLLAIGILSKLFGAIGFYWIVMERAINKKYLFHIIMNDLVWLIPFGVILWRMMVVRKIKKEHAV